MAGEFPFFRRAAAAAAAAGAAAPPVSPLDELTAVLDNPLATARHRVKSEGESLDQLHKHLFPTDARLKLLADVEQDLERQVRLLDQPLLLKDGGEKLALKVARLERYVLLLREQEQLQQAEKQRRRQQQHAPALPPSPQHPTDGEQQADKSKKWLATALSNQEEARAAGGQSPRGSASPPAQLVGLPGSRQVLPKPQQQLTGSRDYRDLGAMPAARGAPQPSKRHERLLGVSGAAGARQRQQPQAARLGGKQQSLPDFLQQHLPSPQTCAFCSKPPAVGKELKRVQIVENEQVVLACFGCIQTNLNLVRPYLDRHQAADRGDSAQQLRPQLALRPSDHGSQARPASVFSQFTAGGEQLPAPGNGRGPSRGKGKQPAQPRKRKGESDEDYDDTVERRQRQQRQGQGRRSGQYGLPPNNGSDSDSLEAMLRPRSTGRRRQAANVS